jgi:hypothetical protein
MAKLCLYLDENIQTALADALMTRGVDVLTTLEAERCDPKHSHTVSLGVVKPSRWHLVFPPQAD